MSLQSNFFISGSLRNAIINMAVEVSDFTLKKAQGNEGAFQICIETAAPIVVGFADGTKFTISAVQAASYLGTWYPANIVKVYKAGTTGLFSAGY